MKKSILMMMLSLALVSCDQHDKRTDTTASEQYNDNTGKNVRDRDSRAQTSFDQSESAEDRTITQKIRQALTADDSLSTNAKNIKIITIKGVVTLRGPVASSQERDAIVQKLNSVPGIAKVDNQLEIAR